MRDIEHSPYEPEFGEIAQSENKDEENVTKTGTTTVGVAVDDGVVVATDRRASLGGRFVANKNVVKVQEVHPTGVVTLVGSVGGAQSFAEHLRAESTLYNSRRSEDMTINALANVAGNFARGGPFFHIFPIVAGVDEQGSHVYTVDPAGGVMRDDYTVTGSGMQVASGTLEQNYEEDMSLEQATHVAAEAVQNAAERDTASGNGLVLAEVTEEGVDITEYDDYSVVDEL